MLKRNAEEREREREREREIGRKSKGARSKDTQEREKLTWKVGRVGCDCRRLLLLGEYNRKMVKLANLENKNQGRTWK